MAVGYPQLHLHDRRHAAGTRAAQTGATLREVMARLGHASPAAAQRYQHAAERRDRVIAQALDVVLDAAVRSRDEANSPEQRCPGRASVHSGTMCHSSPSSDSTANPTIGWRATGTT
jgi:hypothetical protein